MRAILLIAFDGVQPLDVTGPASVFAGANVAAPDSYSVTIASPRGGAVGTSTAVRLADTARLSALDPRAFDTALVAGGEEEGLRSVVFEQGLADWLRLHRQHFRRVGSVCTGSFVLAAAGLLEGRRAATHWASAELLQALSPSTQVDGDSIFAFDGGVFTSAGVTAGIDLCLALVEQDLGRRIAADVARRLVVYLRRPGGQSQYSVSLKAQSAATDTLREVMVWLSEHLGEDLRLHEVAATFALSERTLSRRFKKETGLSVSTWLRGIRVERARSELTESDLPIRAIAERCGFGSIDSLERAFQAVLKIRATDYRARFSSTLSPPSDGG